LACFDSSSLILGSSFLISSLVRAMLFGRMPESMAHNFQRKTPMSMLTGIRAGEHGTQLSAQDADEHAHRHPSRKAWHTTFSAHFSVKSQT
jgi:hypothetical protein